MFSENEIFFDNMVEVEITVELIFGKVVPYRQYFRSLDHHEVLSDSVEKSCLLVRPNNEQ